MDYTNHELGLENLYKFKKCTMLKLYMNKCFKQNVTT